mgnify:CR=1 FL=1
MKRNINKKTVCIIGHFGFAKNLLNGQTVKTKNNYKKNWKNNYGKEEVLKIDTQWWKKENVAVNISITCNYEKCKKYYYDACS